ncbi:MAG: hypothetical protein NW226_00775 [Microscillaceae bacterium]|nr:hypothetical protein [Microscillaceae bacterium]
MNTSEDYPNNFIKEITFPIFSIEDCEKLNTLFDVPLEADLVQFICENAGKTSPKTCLIVPKGEKREVRGFIEYEGKMQVYISLY